MGIFIHTIPFPKACIFLAFYALAVKVNRFVAISGNVHVDMLRSLIENDVETSFSPVQCF